MVGALQRVRGGDIPFRMLLRQCQEAPITDNRINTASCPNTKHARQRTTSNASAVLSHSYGQRQ